mmetsp:Transcript_27739/g.54246  ORF Transcript_27739/g.54246 Transcript_27739/m.54246 type:complete len:155 (-) Transcript_27739:39-503(-)|eukprot:CAMPEP_0173390666 /NCGR_PEP_ID=MMETSP1356-20130122/15748_1 /TAXON_ID=77927 ORGANISM="Hemiselmis virescens, Strain PCC157" /NCGR_SAMPLE_ID=MMETSP1356 /ASSEMBLY_ACC=CAM_ASM_000847 /LENGTH=154 /DNA_ID=CAMNT_0014348115 /DNA_START=59 /DNA_END=523 /DNA_ORIENTATION=+
MATESLFTMLMTKKPGNFAEQIVYEDDKVMAFLDKFPMVQGHTLVVPKKQIERVHEMDEETAAAVGVALMKVAAAVVKATGSDTYNVLNNSGPDAGQEVPHVHFHIIPRCKEDYTASWVSSIEKTRAPGNTKPNKLPDDEFTGEIKTLRDKIRG